MGKNKKVRNKNGKVKKIETEISTEKQNGEVKIKTLRTETEK